MLRFVRRLNYRDRVHEHLNALLVGYPHGRQFAEDFPGLRHAIRSHFEADVSAPGAALQIAARIIAGLLDQLDAAGKQVILKGLIRLDREKLQAMASRRIAVPRPEPREPLAFATELTGLAIFMARRMTEEGVLHRGEYDFFLGALQKAFEWESEGAGALTAQFAFADGPTWSARR